MFLTPSNDLMTASLREEMSGHASVFRDTHSPYNTHDLLQPSRGLEHGLSLIYFLCSGNAVLLVVQ